jgi:hypothetical protein
MIGVAPSGVQAYLRRAHRGTAFLSASAGVVTPAGWLAEVQRRWPVSRTARVAAILAGLAQQRSSLAVTLDPAAVHRVLLQAHVLPPGLGRILDRLITCGLLAQTPSPGVELVTYSLTPPAGLGTAPGQATGNGKQP